MICVSIENYNDANAIRELEIQIKAQVDTTVNYLYTWIDRSLVSNQYDNMEKATSDRRKPL